MKFIQIFLFLVQFSIFNSLKSKSFTYGVRYRNIECKVYDKSFGEFEFCYPKALSRTEVGLNLAYIHYKKMRRPIYITLKSFYRYGTIYREIFHFPPVEWCSYVEGAMNHPMIKYFFSGAKNVEPLLRKCPLDGRFVLSNVTFPGKNNLPIFNTGFYRDVINVTVGKIHVFSVIMYHEIKSEIKSSFG